LLNLASLYAIIEDSVKTIEYLEQGFEMNDSHMPRINNNPDFKELRSEIRFQEMIRKLGLSDYAKEEL